MNRTPIVGMSVDVWRFIREMYDSRCYYCGKGGARLQMEHRIPLARGGNNDISNIVPACESCNRRKGIMTDDEFFKLLAHDPSPEQCPPKAERYASRSIASSV